MSKLCSKCGVNHCGCGGHTICAKCRSSSNNVSSQTKTAQAISDSNKISSTIIYEVVSGKLRMMSNFYSFVWQIENYTIQGNKDQLVDVSMLPKGDYVVIITSGSRTEKKTITI